MKTAVRFTCLVIALTSTLLFSQQVLAADVKITPLGSQEGEFSQLDRALIFD